MPLTSVFIFTHIEIVIAVAKLLLLAVKAVVFKYFVVFEVPKSKPLLNFAALKATELLLVKEFAPIVSVTSSPL